MDSNDAQSMREDDKECQNGSADDAAAVCGSAPSRGDGPQAAGGAAAGVWCPSDTKPHSSLLLPMNGFPEYGMSGGIDWFEWTALIHWENLDHFERARHLIAWAKQNCQEKHLPYQEIDLPDFGPVRVRRVGFNRGGERGQHFEYSLQIPGVKIGLSPRTIPANLSEQDLKKASPHFLAKQTGSDSLLFGAIEGKEMAEALIEAMGGYAIRKRIGRGDLCLDIVGLDVNELLAIVQAKQFIGQASRIRPYTDLAIDRDSGFSAGAHPIYMTAYDKLREQLGKTNMLYLQALVDRRWGGDIPKHAARVEYQMGRQWLRTHGIDTPEQFLTHRGTLAEELTHNWLRLTSSPVDRENKHQSRAATHPLWMGIQEGFAALFGPPQGPLPPIQRDKVQPIALVRQAGGCLATCILQKGIKFQSYAEFVKLGADLLLQMFPDQEERELFLEHISNRRMEYEAS